MKFPNVQVPFPLAVAERVPVRDAPPNEPLLSPGSSVSVQVPDAVDAH